jgi:hypothetical protein
MTLDDVYGSDQDKFPLEQEAINWDEEDLGLDLGRNRSPAPRPAVGGAQRGSHRFDLH